MTDNEKISLKEIKEAIYNSGYLIEQRVEQVFRKNDFLVSANLIYKDIETGKHREMDISASKYVEIKEKEIIGFEILCECENNKQPIVFFESDYDYCDYANSLKYISLPINFNYLLNDLGYPEKQPPLFDGLFSTQYCSFIRPKQKNSNWIAHHPDEQHNTFDSFIKKYRFTEKLNENFLFESLQNERRLPLLFSNRLSGTIYFMLVVLQGDIFNAKVKNDDIYLKKTKHIKFVKNSIGTNQMDTFFIDVIQEDYLETYIKYIKKEINCIGLLIKQNREDLINSKNKEIKKLQEEIEKIKNNFS